MREIRIVAVYKFDDSIEVISTRSNSPLYDLEIAQAKSLEDLGAKLIRCIITTDRVLHTKAKLEANLLELRNLTERNNNYLQEHMGFLPLGVLSETQKLMEEVENSMMFKVAITTSRLLNMGVEVTDELAIACYNYRTQQRGF